MTIDVGTVFGRGFGFEFGLSSAGQVAFSEGPINIRESLEIILSTEPGERVMRPTFGAGLRTFLYEPNNASTRRLIEERVIRSIERWEPRVRLESVTVAPHQTELSVAVVQIHYRLVATGETSQLSLGVDVAVGGAT